MTKFNLNNLIFILNSENEIKTEKFSVIKSGDISEYLLNLEFNDEIAPKPYSITWEEPLIDGYGFWSPSSKQNSTINADWNLNVQKSRTASGMPIISIYNKANENVTTVYTSDVANACSLSVGVVEATVNLKYTLTLFTEVMPKISNYSIVLRIDHSKIPFYSAIKNARDWWSEIGYPCAYVPSDAITPLYSFWYS